MICDNCGKKEANIMYSENINGVKKQLHLCEECSKKLGIGKMNFSIPIDFSNFFEDFMEDFSAPEYMPLMQELKTLHCDQCGYSFDDIVNSGKLGCGNCYNTFDERLDPIIKRIQGANKHIGRIGKITEKANSKETNNTSEHINDELNNLQVQLKQAIKEERYEEAAKIRDQIKKFEK